MASILLHKICKFSKVTCCNCGDIEFLQILFLLAPPVVFISSGLQFVIVILGYIFKPLHVYLYVQIVYEK